MIRNEIKENKWLETKVLSKRFSVCNLSCNDVASQVALAVAACERRSVADPWGGGGGGAGRSVPATLFWSFYFYKNEVYKQKLVLNECEICLKMLKFLNISGEACPQTPLENSRLRRSCPPPPLKILDPPMTLIELTGCEKSAQSCFLLEP